MCTFFSLRQPPNPLLGYITDIKKSAHLRSDNPTNALSRLLSKTAQSGRRSLQPDRSLHSVGLVG